MKRGLSIVLTIAMVTTMFVANMGCGATKTYQPVSGLDQTQNVTLKIAIPQETNKALNTVANLFMKKYPNVNIQLEYIEDYDKNAVQLFKDNQLDIILRKDVKYEEYMLKDEETEEEIPTGTTTEDYFYNFAADPEIDFSDTTPDLSDNYLHTRLSDDNTQITYQYSYPLGGEMRGLFVNKTMLKSLGLSVPKNYQEFVECCEVIKQNGYIPIQGHISSMAYGLGIAHAANTVTHNEEGLLEMSKASPGVSSYFEPTMGKLYELCKKRNRKDAKTIPIIALTADAFTEEQKRMLDAGMNARLIKPFKPEDLYAAIESHSIE